MGEYSTAKPIPIKLGDEIELTQRRKALLHFFEYSEKREKLSVSVNFERCSAFMRITYDSFGDLNPKELKETICKAIDEYYAPNFKR